MFTEDFMQRAFLAAILLGPLCGLLGVFVTARRMAFFSDTVAHGALTGVAIGFWLGFAEPTIPMVGFSLVIAVLMMWLKEKTDLLTDSIMALLLSGSVALGIIILSLLQNKRGDLHRFLFGDILAVEPHEVIFAGVLFFVISAGIFSNLSSLTLLTAHEDMAHVSGVSVRRMNYLFVIVLTLTVAVSIRLLGIMLVTSLLVIPSAAARNLSLNLRQQIIWSVLLGLVSGFLGTAATYHFNLPCGPAITMTSIALFIVSLGFRRFARVRVTV